LTVIVVSFFESVLEDHSKDHPMAVVYLRSDTLTGIRTPPRRTQLFVSGPAISETHTRQYDAITSLHGIADEDYARFMSHGFVDEEYAESEMVRKRVTAAAPDRAPSSTAPAAPLAEFDQNVQR
jgi:hypothetical protein